MLFKILVFPIGLFLLNISYVILVLTGYDLTQGNNYISDIIEYCIE
jgi:hypothetical protein